MSRFTEEHIFNYLDQVLMPGEVAAFEQELQSDPELKSRVEKLQVSHRYFLENRVEAGPEQISDQVMVAVTELSQKKYYRPSGLFNSTSFLLTAGILTAVVAFLSVANAGYFDLQNLAPGLTETSIFKEWTFLKAMVNKRVLTNAMVVIYCVLALALVDRLILNPIFRKRVKNLGFN